MPLGGTELLLILVIVLIIFGAGKLPQVFGSLGKGVREFREASEGGDTTGTPENAAGTGSVTTTTVAPTGTATGVQTGETSTVTTSPARSDADSTPRT